MKDLMNNTFYDGKNDNLPIKDVWQKRIAFILSEVIISNCQYEKKSFHVFTFFVFLMSLNVKAH